MNTHKIPINVPEIIKPKVPFTNIPNPFGTAKAIYGEKIVHYIPLYYVQRLIEYIFKAITLPFKYLLCLYYKWKVKKSHFIVKAVKYGECKRNKKEETEL